MEVEPLTVISGILILTVLATGVLGWVGILAKWLALEGVFPSRIKAIFSTPLFAIGLVLAYLGLNSFAALFATEDQIENLSTAPADILLLSNILISILLFALILWTMKFRIEDWSRPIAYRAYGITFDDFFRQFTTAVWGVCLSFPLVILFLQFTIPFRKDDQPANPLLQMLGENPAVEVIVMIVLLAVVIAPILEELMFRVVLQGWLSQKISAYYSVPIVAVLFSIAHGLPDAIGLLPLALVLGVMYHRGDRYYSIVLTHAFFNSIMLFAAWANANAVDL